jgi:L-malate glycosyltransferase
LHFKFIFFEKQKGREKTLFKTTFMSEIVQKRTKVLHLIKSLGRGGAEKLIPETALVHDQSKFEFHCLYFFHQEENITDELQRAGIQPHLIPAGNLELFFKIKKVRHFVLENGIDIIHAHLPWAGILARFVGKKLSIPVVYTEHNTWERYNKISYFANRITFKHQDIAIAVSNEVALSIRLNSFWDPYRREGRLKVRVVQNGVNTEVFTRERKAELSQNPKLIFQTEESWLPIPDPRLKSKGVKRKLKSENFGWEDCGTEVAERDWKQSYLIPKRLGFSNDPSLRSQLGIPEEAKVIGKVAVFRSQKRLNLWVELALRILEKCPATHFILVGDGELKELIRSQIEESQRGSQFHLVGLQKNVVPYLSLMDIYLSTSEFEGMPIAMLEAMSCEVPVVATRAGGIGEVIQHGKQGFVEEVEDWEELEKYCIELLLNPELHNEMSREARSRVLAKFSMKRMVRELEEIYLEAGK